MIRGHCVFHEVDVVGKNGKERITVECKFHQNGGRCDLKTALYVKARFDDIQEACDQDVSCGPKYDGCWLVTNTKFTSIAIEYAVCRGVRLLAWSYPEHEGLEALIDRYGLHPITCVMSLPAVHAHTLIRSGVVLCKDLIEQKNVLQKLPLSDAKKEKIIRESNLVCRRQ
jgi:hypothetical protein